MDPLAQLKDLHLPPPPGLWPPAPGWWLLAILGCVLIGWGIRALLVWRRRNAYRRQALAQLKQMLADNNFTLNDVIKLVRRTAISGVEGSPWATLSGPKVLARLDDFSGGELFNTFGSIDQEAMKTRLYSANDVPLSVVQRDALGQLLRHWIRRHRRAELC